ncbi:MAG: hypothetical protein AB8F78_14440 [Saprospiraceae bacterium]
MNVTPTFRYILIAASAAIITISLIFRSAWNIGILLTLLSSGLVILSQVVELRKSAQH